MLSASDDKTVRWWDLATEQHLACLRGHTDYVRCASVSPASRDLWATGSYDHTVRLWDMRTGEGAATMSVDHGAPRNVLLLPGGGLMVSAGGNTLKVWDVLGGGRLVRELSHHQKNITSLCLDGTQTRLLVLRLERAVYDLRTYEVTFGLVGRRHVARGVGEQPPARGGLSTGGCASNARRPPRLPRRERAATNLAVFRRAARAAQRGAATGGTHRYFMRGRNAGPEEDDFGSRCGATRVSSPTTRCCGSKSRAHRPPQPVPVAGAPPPPAPQVR